MSENIIHSESLQEAKEFKTIMSQINGKANESQFRAFGAARFSLVREANA